MFKQMFAFYSLHKLLVVLVTILVHSNMFQITIILTKVINDCSISAE
jgi:hypothetical protein